MNKLLAIAYAKEAGTIISFDPNIRLALWENEQELRKAVLAFLPKANILKILDEEIAFLTRKETVADSVTVEHLSAVTAEKMAQYLDFSDRYCTNSVRKSGAIASYPAMYEM